MKQVTADPGIMPEPDLYLSSISDPGVISDNKPNN